MTRQEAGFTIPELIIVMTITALMSLLIMNFALDFWGSTSTLENDAETFVSRQNSGDRLREALNVSSSFINQNSITDTHANIPDPTDVTGTHWQLIHAIPGSIAMPTTGSKPVLYFQAPSTNSSRNFIMNGAQPYQDEFVLYLDASSKQLLLRTLVNPLASGDRLQTSCPPAQATASCPADKVMGTEISAVSTRYFSRSGNTIDYTSITDPLTGNYIGPDFPVVEVLELTLHLQRKATIHGATNTSNETIIRVTSRNG
jgi:prepilin-type N-terminal cleavage/methylation domain-containing protein